MRKYARAMVVFAGCAVLVAMGARNVFSQAASLSESSSVSAPLPAIQPALSASTSGSKMDMGVKALFAPPDGLDAVAHASVLSPAESSSLGMLNRPVAPARKPHLGKSYFVLNSINLGMALFDVGMTQHCIADQHCAEANPLMPKPLGAKLGINIGLVGYGAFVSSFLKRRQSRNWWIPPSSGIGFHGVGVISGFVHR